MTNYTAAIHRESGGKGKSRVIGVDLTDEMALEFDFGCKGKSFVFTPFSIFFSLENLLSMNWH